MQRRATGVIGLKRDNSRPGSAYMHDTLSQGEARAASRRSYPASSPRMCSFSRDEPIRTIDERRVASVAAKIARKISTAFDAAKHPAKRFSHLRQEAS